MHPYRCAIFAADLHFDTAFAGLGQPESFRVACGRRERLQAQDVVAEEFTQLGRAAGYAPLDCWTDADGLFAVQLLALPG